VPATNELLMEIGATTVMIASDDDIVIARQRGRALVVRMGFAPTDATLVATAVSELARNIVLYAKRGDITLKPLENRGRRGILVVARDEGPGIPDIQRAIGGGCSTGGSPGLGLCGVKRLMDEFEIVSVAGIGTTVCVKKFSGPAFV
jgi:serine/threonine-protein kinase RsbT